MLHNRTLLNHESCYIYIQEAAVFNKAMSYIVEAHGKVGKPGMA